MAKKLLLSIGLTLCVFEIWNIASSPAQGQPEPELILFNSKIVTVDSAFSYRQAVAITDGKVQTVGSDAEILRMAGARTRRIDLRGKTVVPGMSDNHLHDAGGGEGVDLSQVRDFKEFLDAIAARVRQSKPGEVVLANGDWHPGQLKEQRMPLRRELDQVSPDNPVVVPRNGHVSILNTAALKLWNITKETPVPAGGEISRYDDGELDGLLLDSARGLVRLPRPAPRDFETRIRDQQAEYLKLNASGITSIRHPGMSADQFQLLQEMKRRGLLTVRVNAMFRLGGNARTPQEIETWSASLNVKPDEGDEWLRVWGIKMGVDGGVEGAWMTEPFAEPFGRGGTYKGLQTAQSAPYIAAVKELSRLGWRVGTHAVGDAAIDLVLTAYEEASQTKSIVGRRWAIEHAFTPRADQFAKINRLGVNISAQDHLYVSGETGEAQWGEKRANWFTPLRAYLDNVEDKMAISTGTDSPVVPYSPLLAFYHFVTRKTISGNVYGADQRVSREEALRLSTINNAYLNFQENIKGSLEPGKVADLVVLSEDIMTAPEENIRGIGALLTVVGGKIVFQHKDFSF